MPPGIERASQSGKSDREMPMCGTRCRHGVGIRVKRTAPVAEMTLDIECRLLEQKRVAPKRRFGLLSLGDVFAGVLIDPTSMGRRGEEQDDGRGCVDRLEQPPVAWSVGIETEHQRGSHDESPNHVRPDIPESDSPVRTPAVRCSGRRRQVHVAMPAVARRWVSLSRPIPPVK